MAYLWLHLRDNWQHEIGSQRNCGCSIVDILASDSTAQVQVSKKLQKLDKHQLHKATLKLHQRVCSINFKKSLDIAISQISIRVVE